MARQMRPSAPQDKTDLVLKWICFGLSILGAVDALYLWVLKITQSEAMCVGNHGCITVNNSIYSEIYGIPISVFGIAAYLVMAVILLLETRLKFVKENSPLAVFGISLGGVAFSAYLTYLEFAVIDAICPFCITSAVIITLIFILAIIRLVKQISL